MKKKSNHQSNHLDDETQANAVTRRIQQYNEVAMVDAFVLLKDEAQICMSAIAVGRNISFPCAFNTTAQMTHHVAGGTSVKISSDYYQVVNKNFLEMAKSGGGKGQMFKLRRNLADGIHRTTSPGGHVFNTFWNTGGIDTNVQRNVIEPGTKESLIHKLAVSTKTNDVESGNALINDTEFSSFLTQLGVQQGQAGDKLSCIINLTEGGHFGTDYKTVSDMNIQNARLLLGLQSQPSVFLREWNSLKTGANLLSRFTIIAGLVVERSTYLKDVICQPTTSLLIAHGFEPMYIDMHLELKKGCTISRTEYNELYTAANIVDVSQIREHANTEFDEHKNNDEDEDEHEDELFEAPEYIPFNPKNQKEYREQFQNHVFTQSKYRYRQQLIMTVEPDPFIKYQQLITAQLKHDSYFLSQDPDGNYVPVYYVPHNEKLCIQGFEKYHPYVISGGTATFPAKKGQYFLEQCFLHRKCIDKAQQGSAFYLNQQQKRPELVLRNAVAAKHVTNFSKYMLYKRAETIRNIGSDPWISVNKHNGKPLIECEELPELMKQQVKYFHELQQDESLPRNNDNSNQQHDNDADNNEYANNVSIVRDDSQQKLHQLRQIAYRKYTQAKSEQKVTITEVMNKSAAQPFNPDDYKNPPVLDLVLRANDIQFGEKMADLQISAAIVLDDFVNAFDNQSSLSHANTNTIDTANTKSKIKQHDPMVRFLDSPLPLQEMCYVWKHKLFDAKARVFFIFMASSKRTFKPFENNWNNAATAFTANVNNFGKNTLLEHATKIAQKNLFWRISAESMNKNTKKKDIEFIKNDIIDWLPMMKELSQQERRDVRDMEPLQFEKGMESSQTNLVKNIICFIVRKLITGLKDFALEHYWWLLSPSLCSIKNCLVQDEELRRYAEEKGLALLQKHANLSLNKKNRSWRVFIY